MKKFMKNNKKGFTLVELIVVLVILAILAALLIPALTGYIDKAKEKSVIAETRQFVMAAQTIVDEKSASTQAGIYYTLGTDSTDLTEIKELAEVKGTCNLASDVTYDGGRIYGLIYTAANGKVCMYRAEPTTGEEKYTVAKTAAELGTLPSPAP